MAIIFPADPGAQSPTNIFGPNSSPEATNNGAEYLWDGEKWVSLGLGKGQVQTVKGDLPITVNNTDPTNPVIGIDESALEANIELSDLEYTYPGGEEQTLQKKIEQYITPEDFGAVADFREIHGTTVGVKGAGQLGTVTFPLGNGNFTSDDIGKLCVASYVDNGSNNYADGAIDSVTNANEIEIKWRTAANAIATNVRFAVGTDNEDALQLLMQHCSENPGTRVQLTGKYGIGIGTDDSVLGPLQKRGAISLASNTGFFGTGAESSGFYKLSPVNSAFNVGSGVVNGTWEGRNYYFPASINKGDKVIDFSSNTADYAALKVVMMDYTKNRARLNLIGVRSSEINGSPNAGGRYMLGGSIAKILEWDDTNYKLYIEYPLGFDIPNPRIYAPNDDAVDHGINWTDDYFSENIELHDLTMGMGCEGSALACNGSYKTTFENVKFESEGRFNTNSVCYGKFINCEFSAAIGGPEFKVGSNQLYINNCKITIHQSALPGTGQVETASKFFAGTIDDPIESMLALGEGIQNVFVDGLFVDFSGLWAERFIYVNPGCATFNVQNIHIKCKGLIRLFECNLTKKDSRTDFDLNPLPEDSYYMQQTGVRLVKNLLLENDEVNATLININNSGRNDQTDNFIPSAHLIFDSIYTNMEATYVGASSVPMLIKLYGPNQTVTSGTFSNIEGVGSIFCGVGSAGSLLDTCDFKDILFNNITCDGLSQTDFATTGAGNGKTFQVTAKNITRINEGALRQVQVSGAEQRPQNILQIEATGNYETFIGPVNFPEFNYLRGLDYISLKGALFLDRATPADIDLKFDVSSTTLSDPLAPIELLIPQFTLNQNEPYSFDGKIYIARGDFTHNLLASFRVVQNGILTLYEESVVLSNNPDSFQRDISVAASAISTESKVCVIDYSCIPVLYSSN